MTDTPSPQLTPGRNDHGERLIPRPGQPVRPTAPLCETVGHISDGPCPGCGPCRYCDVFLQHTADDRPFMGDPDD